MENSSGDTKQQEELVEVYLKLLNTALEDDYFICDYNSKYNVAGSNELFQSCTPMYPFIERSNSFTNISY